MNHIANNNARNDFNFSPHRGSAAISALPIV